MNLGRGNVKTETVLTYTTGNSNKGTASVNGILAWLFDGTSGCLLAVVLAALAIVWLLYLVLLMYVHLGPVLASIVVLIISASVARIIYLYRRKVARARAEEMAREQKRLGEDSASKQKRFQEVLKSLETPRIEAMISKFLEKHDDEWDPSSLDLFYKWLGNEGLVLLGTDELNQVLKELHRRRASKRQSDEFDERMSRYPQNTLNDILDAFLDEYGRDHENQLSLLFSLLEEKQIEHNPPSIVDTLRSNLASRELQSFEIELLHSREPSLKHIDVDALNGEDFEKLLSLLFRRMGYLTSLTSASHDQGADLIVSRDGVKTVIQAKRTYGPVGNKAVQEAVAAVKHYCANKAMVVTNSTFTPAAVRLASSNHVELVDGIRLRELMERYL